MIASASPGFYQKHFRQPLADSGPARSWTPLGRVKSVILRNRVAYALWGFALIVLVFVVLMTSLAIRDDFGDPDSRVLVTGVLVLFWFATIGLLTFAASQPVTEVRTAVGGGLDVNRRCPLRRESRHVAVADIAEVYVKEGYDDEGDAYFTTRVTLKDGTFVDLAHSHDRTRCDDVLRRFKSALG